MQEFEYTMKDWKGTENQVVDNLWILKDEDLLEIEEKGDIKYMFLDEKV